MFSLFLICAAIGGSVFLFQFLLAVLGAGADSFDIADDLPTDVPHDLDIPHGVDVPHDIDMGDAPGHLVDHGSTLFFGILTLKTVMAALMFFGLCGIAALEAGQSSMLSLLIAVAAGLIAMYGVHYLMKMLYRLRHDGTAKIQRTVGARGTVYIPVPANEEGRGRVQLRSQGRILEYAAVTPSPTELKTGTPIEVVSIVSPSVVEVQPVIEPASGGA